MLLRWCFVGVMLLEISWYASDGDLPLGKPNANMQGSGTIASPLSQELRAGLPSIETSCSYLHDTLLSLVAEEIYFIKKELMYHAPQ